ncbi:ester cyclase [Micromonospora sp. KC207]|uniref:ester cyclase n=1 Tax=Micromonospora sp. KC207 TaxID=2530377 RepID=UPI00140531D3|nr:ester cyclase [Micromonospora sp. KC207]
MNWRALGLGAALAALGVVGTPARADAARAGRERALHRLACEYERLANAHDLDGLVALHDAAAYVAHEPNGATSGIDVYRQRTQGFFTGFSDGRIELLNVVAEGDLFVMNFLTRGTNDGPFMGAPPTGRTVEFAEVRVRRVARGRIVEQWGLLDLPTLQAQLRG